LRELGLSVDEARAVISRFVGLGSAKPEGHLAFTPRVAKALEKAGEASLELGHNYIGTEHVLLGVLREGENVGCLLLVEAGLELSRVRLKLLESMRFPQPAVAPDSAPAGALDRVLAQIAEIGERLARIEQRLT
jgi:ATP-dependent Clp protease ATP-binding subunit ClpC